MVVVELGAKVQPCKRDFVEDNEGGISQTVLLLHEGEGERSALHFRFTGLQLSSCPGGVGGK